MYEVYGKKNCTYCTMTQKLLEKRKADFIYYDIEADEEKRKEMMQRSPYARTVPQIFKNDVLIGGYSELIS